MKKSPTFIAIAILALMLGACASTNDTARSDDNPNELPSIAERQDQIAYTDISEDATTKEVIVTEKPVLESTATVTHPTDSTMTSSSTTVDTTATLSGTTSTSSTPSSSLNTTTTTTTTNTNNNSSMISSSTADDTNDQEDTATASRTRMRKD